MDSTDTYSAKDCYRCEDEMVVGALWWTTGYFRLPLLCPVLLLSLLHRDIDSLSFEI
jgi:hypothetical protein